MNYNLIAGILACTLIFCSFDLPSEHANHFDNLEEIILADANACYKSKPGKFKYKVIVKEPKMKSLKMIGRVGRFGVGASSKQEILHGKMLRALRFQNITRKVERKYGLPKI